MIDLVTFVLALLVAYGLGLATGIYYLKNKVMNQVGGLQDSNPEEMMEDAMDMIMGSPEDGEVESKHSDRKPDDANTEEKLDSILSDEEVEPEDE